MCTFYTGRSDNVSLTSLDAIFYQEDVLRMLDIAWDKISDENL
jgi:hypothetical protein